MIWLLRQLLYPVSLLYAFVVWLRNRLYDMQLLKSRSFGIPIVVIGNLAVGGTGKSPMTEYVLRIIGASSRIAILSRGYGRKTKGFRYVKADDLTATVGDEPLQIKRKFPQHTVAVCEDRVKGVEQLLESCDAVLLDDAYQHRALTPSFSILLFDYQSMLQPMLPLPTGNFRDSLQESRRAGCMVITKCPDHIDPNQKFDIMAQLRRHSEAPIFFSRIVYEGIIDSNKATYKSASLAQTSILLVTGIANPAPLKSYLSAKTSTLEQIIYPDHHRFSDSDLQNIGKSWERIDSKDKIIVTTEKDIQRLPASFLDRYPVFYVPIHQEILFNESETFESTIKNAFQR